MTKSKVNVEEVSKKVQNNTVKRQKSNANGASRISHVTSHPQSRKQMKVNNHIKTAAASRYQTIASPDHHSNRDIDDILTQEMLPGSRDCRSSSVEERRAYSNSSVGQHFNFKDDLTSNNGIMVRNFNVL